MRAIHLPACTRHADAALLFSPERIRRTTARGGKEKRREAKRAVGKQTEPFHRRSSSFGCSAAIIVGAPVKDLLRHGPPPLGSPLYRPHSFFPVPFVSGPPFQPGPSFGDTQRFLLPPFKCVEFLLQVANGGAQNDRRTSFEPFANFLGIDCTKRPSHRRPHADMSLLRDRPPQVWENRPDARGRLDRHHRRS